MDFYLEALDRQERKENENPSVGVILCASKDEQVVEYAMSRTMSPTKVSQFQDIKNDCLMIAYDNKKYYNLESEEQRKLLIQDVIKYGIKILSEDNIDRFKLIGQTLSIKEIIDIMENEIEKILN